MSDRERDLGTVRQPRLLLRRPSSWWRLVSSDFVMSARSTWLFPPVWSVGWSLGLWGVPCFPSWSSWSGLREQLLQGCLLLLKGFHRSWWKLSTWHCLSLACPLCIWCQTIMVMDFWAPCCWTTSLWSSTGCLGYMDFWGGALFFTKAGKEDLFGWHPRVMCNNYTYAGLGCATTRSAYCWADRPVWVKDVAVCETLQD